MKIFRKIINNCRNKGKIELKSSKISDNLREILNANIAESGENMIKLKKNCAPIDENLKKF